MIAREREEMRIARICTLKLESLGVTTKTDHLLGYFDNFNFRHIIDNTISECTNRPELPDRIRLFIYSLIVRLYAVYLRIPLAIYACDVVIPNFIRAYGESVYPILTKRTATA